MPQNSHGIMMSPSAWTAWGWDEGAVLRLLDPPARRPLHSHGFGEELLLLNEAKALAGLHPVCYTNNTEKSPFLKSQVGIENHFPWQRPKCQMSPHPSQRQPQKSLHCKPQDTRKPQTWWRIRSSAGHSSSQNSQGNMIISLSAREGRVLSSVGSGKNLLLHH